MAQIKVNGNQLEIQSVASEMAADATAIGSIASGITTDPGAIAALDADYLRLDGTVTMLGNLNLGVNNILTTGTVDGRSVSADWTTTSNHIADLVVHRTINDAGVALTDLWSGSKIGGDLALKADDSVLTAHTGDATIHFTQAAISITESQISDLGIYELANANIQAHIIDTANPHATGIANLGDVVITTLTSGDLVSFDGLNWVNVPSPIDGVTDHTLLTNIGTNTHAQIDTHIADAVFHFTEASIDHTAILNAGTITHASLDAHVSNTLLFHPASAITNTASGTIIATDVQAAINELDVEKAPLVSPALTGTPTTATGILADATAMIANNAFVAQEIAAIPAAPVADVFGRTGNVVSAIGDYTASEVLFVPTGSPGLAATDVQLAIEELNNEKATVLHLHAGTDITNVPAGNIAATDIQAAIDELDVEKATVVHNHVVADVIDFSAGVIMELGLNSFTSLADVSYIGGSPSPAVDDALVFDGVNWTNLPTILSFNSRTGIVVPVAGDYIASDITNTPAGNIAATDIQAAIDELDVEKATVASPVFTGVPVLPKYTLVTLPVVIEAGIIYVTDANAGAGAMCYGQIFGSPDVWVDVTTGIGVA